ncbi:MAG: VOC family protein [Rhodanobacteraceae bacterium]
MSEVIKTRFVLAVLDLKKSTDYYASVLGLAIDFEVPGWSFLSRGNFQVMLGECPDAIPPAKLGDHSYYGYITVSDIDSLYAEYQKAGVQFNPAAGRQALGHARVRHSHDGWPQTDVWSRALNKRALAPGISLRQTHTRCAALNSSAGRRDWLPRKAKKERPPWTRRRFNRLCWVSPFSWWR